QHNQREDLVDGFVQIHVEPDTTYTRSYVYGGPRPHAPTHVLEPGAIPPKAADLTFDYDADGNQLTRTERGAPHPAVAQVWDSEDRLKQASVNGGDQQMLYDGDGARSHSITHEKLSVYVNPSLTVSDERIFNKHIYAGNLRIATKVDPQNGPRPATFF